MTPVDLAAVDSSSRQMARAIKLARRCLEQVCDGDLPSFVREHAEHRYYQAIAAAEDLRKLYARAQTGQL